MDEGVHDQSQPFERLFGQETVLNGQLNCVLDALRNSFVEQPALLGRTDAHGRYQQCAGILIDDT